MFRQVLDGCWFAWLVRVHRVWTGSRQTRKILVGGMTAGSGRVGMDPQEAVVDPPAQGGPMMSTQESAVDP